MHEVVSEAVFPSGGPTPRCHASTLTSLPDDGWLCGWFGGTSEGARDSAIWVSERTASGWSSPERAAKVSDLPHWNPVLHRDGDAVHLFFKVGVYPSRWHTWVCTRTLGDPAWSIPRELVPGDVPKGGGRGPVKNKPIVLADGAWLAPGSVEDDGGWDCFADRSEDGGLTWERSELVPRAESMGVGIIQPTLWESEPGQIHMLARSRQGWVYAADSTDGGRTWSPARRTELHNNNSGLDVAQLDDGRLVLALNPVQRGRTPLALLTSTDQGRTWGELATLESSPGEYSYPAVVATPSGFGVCYTWRRETIWFSSWKLT